MFFACKRWVHNYAHKKITQLGKKSNIYIVLNRLRKITEIKKRVYLSGVERYFCFSNRFSKPISCSSVNTVLLLLPFLVLLTASAPGSSFPRRWRSSGRWWDEEPTCRPAAPDRSAEPNGAPNEQDRGDTGNFRIPVWSAFRTGSKTIVCVCVSHDNLVGTTTCWYGIFMSVKKRVWMDP